jgi:glycosyltransferase involved in cell wall biosynthesis
MRILYLQTFPLSGSGSGTYARELAKEVAKRHNVAMVAPDAKRKILGVKMYPVDLRVKIAFTGHPEWPGCKLFVKVAGEDLTRNYLAFFEETIRAVHDFEPDIIHVHHLMPLAWIARYIKMAYGINYIVTGHGSELPTMQADKRYIPITVESLKKASRIVPNSYWTKQWMHDVLGNRFHRQTRVIPGGVDIENFPEAMDQKIIDEVNQRYKLFPEWKLVLFSGKLTKYKGVKYLVQAAKQINGIVGILGDGPERASLEQLADDLNLDNVKFFGHQESSEVIKLYYRASVSVAPSIWDEPLGLVILEAMATKTPVVVTRKGGIPLAVKDGINGVYIKPRNAKDIADKVNKLLANDTMRGKLGNKARQTIVDKFTWEQIAHRFELMYAEFKKKEKVTDAGPLDELISRIFGKR